MYFKLKLVTKTACKTRAQAITNLLQVNNEDIATMGTM